MTAAKAAALAFVEGWKVEELERLSEEIFDELMADRIWSGTHALARLHLDAGQRVWLVTAAPVELGRIIAQRLGLTGALGTVAEIRDGEYTGRLVGDMLHGPAKADAITALAEAEGLDLERCSAYSDSVNDTPMLSLVGHAVAVNPDSALRREARRRGWELRDFRTGRKAAKVAVPAALGTGAWPAPPWPGSRCTGAAAAAAAWWRTSSARRYDPVTPDAPPGAGSSAALIGLVIAVLAAGRLLTLPEPEPATPAAAGSAETSVQDVWPDVRVVQAPGRLPTAAPTRPGTTCDAETSVGTALTSDGAAMRLLVRGPAGAERELIRLPADDNPQFNGFATAGDDLVFMVSGGRRTPRRPCTGPTGGPAPPAGSPPTPAPSCSSTPSTTW